MSSGAMAERSAQELNNRKTLVEMLIKVGVDVSGFTDEVIADPQAFWKLADTYKDYKTKIDALMRANKESMKDGMST